MLEIVGIGIAAYGLYQSYSSSKSQQKQSQQQYAAQQDQYRHELAVRAQTKELKGHAEELYDIAQSDQFQQDDVRQTAMRLDASRRKREIIREAIVAHSVALTTATGQGAGQSSAIEGAYAQIRGRQGVNTLGINQQLEAGEQLFGLKRHESIAYREAARTLNQIEGAQPMAPFAPPNTTGTALGAGAFSAGSALSKSGGTFDKVGSYLSSFGSGSNTFSSPTDSASFDFSSDAGTISAMS